MLLVGADVLLSEGRGAGVQLLLSAWTMERRRTCCTLQRPQMSPPNKSWTKTHLRVNEQSFVHLH